MNFPKLTLKRQKSEYLISKCYYKINPKLLSFKLFYEFLFLLNNTYNKDKNFKTAVCKILSKTVMNCTI